MKRRSQLNHQEKWCAKLILALLIVLLVQPVSSQLACEQLTRFQPSGFRMALHIGGTAAVPEWLVIAKNKHTYKMYHETTVGHGRAYFVWTELPPLVLHDTANPAEIDYAYETGAHVVFATQDVMAFYTFTYTRDSQLERVLSHKFSSLRNPTFNKINEIFYHSANTYRVWIGKELWEYNTATGIALEKQILVAGVPADFYIFQQFHYGWNVWINSATDFTLKSQKDGETVINTINYNTAVEGPAFIINRVLAIKAAGNACFSLLMESETKMWVLISEVGKDVPWGGIGMRFKREMVKKPGVYDYNIFNFFTSGKRWIGVQGGDYRMRIFRVHTSSWWQLYFGGEDKYLPAVNDNEWQWQFKAQRRDYVLTNDGPTSYILFGGEDRMIYLSVNELVSEYRFLVDKFVAAPYRVSKDLTMFRSRSGWCFFEGTNNFNFKLCANIDFITDVRHIGSPSTNDGMEVAVIRGTHLGTARHNFSTPDKVVWQPLWDLTTSLAGFEIQGIQVCGAIANSNLYFAKVDLIAPNGFFGIAKLNSTVRAQFISKYIRNSNRVSWHPTREHVSNGIEGMLCVYGGFTELGNGKINCIHQDENIPLGDEANYLGFSGLERYNYYTITNDFSTEVVAVASPSLGFSAFIAVLQRNLISNFHKLTLLMIEFNVGFSENAWMDDFTYSGDQAELDILTWVESSVQRFITFPLDLRYSQSVAFLWNQSIPGLETKIYAGSVETISTRYTLLNQKGEIATRTPSGATCFSCHATCRTCNGGLDTNCISCHPWRLFNGVTGKCDILCHAECLTCSGTTRLGCLSCVGSLLLSPQKSCCHQNCHTCIGQAITNCTQCRTGWYLSIDTCYQCNAACLTCDQGANSDCLSCHPGYLLQLDGTCLLNCHASCLTCTGPNQNQCATCTAPLIKTALNYCCHPECNSCTGGLNSECTACVAPLGFSGGYCCNSLCKTCTGSQIDACTSCTSPLIQGTNGRCCHSSCTSCNGTLATNCTGCQPGKFLSLGSCLPCDISCTTCSATNGSICTTCNILGGYSAHPTITGLCVKCDASCLTCTQSLDNQACASCYTSNILSTVNSCFFKCPTAQYKPTPIDPLSQICTPCHLNCKECIGTSNTDCIECYSGKNLTSPINTTVYESSGLISTVYLKKGACNPDCSVGKFLDPITQACVNCPTQCFACVSLNECTSCSNATEKVFITSPSLKTDCLGWCQSTEYRKNDGTCQPCNVGCIQCIGPGYQQCAGVNCKSGYTKVLNNPLNSSVFTCNLNCMVGQYQNSTGGCSSCHQSCSTCQGPNADDCLTCKQHFVHAQYQGQLNGPCNCITSSGFFLDSGGICQSCDVTCGTCNGQLNVNCLTCKPNSLQIRGTAGVLLECKQSCLTTQYYDPLLFQCKICKSGCKTCLNGTTCASCPQGTLFHQNQCLGVCPEGFASTDSINCVRCTDANCKKCASTYPNTCQQCKSGFVIKGSSCVNTCPEFKLLVDSQCRSCQPQCRECALNIGLPYDFNNLKCLKCDDGLVLFQDNCQQGCPSGTQRIVNPNGSITCLEVICSRLCLDCASSSICRKCLNSDPNDPAIGVFQTFDGRCVTCQSQNGLVTKINPATNQITSCEEICGDTISYKKSLKLKASDPLTIGGQAITTKHSCDDGNTKDGDGCSSICAIESGFSCQTSDESGSKGKCVTMTNIELKMNSSKEDPLTYGLNFSRGVNLTYDRLSARYRLSLEPSDSSKPAIPNIGYQINPVSDNNYNLFITDSQFTENVKGTIKFWMKEEYKLNLEKGMRRLLINSQDDIKDSENMRINMENINAEFEFDMEQYKADKAIDATTKNINKVTGNPAMQILIFLVALNPLMFTFTANVLQRFVYYRALHTTIPSNLNSFFKILGASWGIKTGSTDYAKGQDVAPRGFTDKLFGIYAEDQSPPIKYQEMKYSDIYIKSALPIFIINFVIYMMVLFIIMINRLIKKSEIDRLKSLAKEKSSDAVHKTDMSKCKKTLSRTFEIAETHFRWNGLIRTNLLIYQNFTLGLFLNIAKGYDSGDKPLLKTSYMLSWVSLLLVFMNAYVFYHVVERYAKPYNQKMLALEEQKGVINLKKGQQEEKKAMSQNNPIKIAKQQPKHKQTRSKATDDSVLKDINQSRDDNLEVSSISKNTKKNHVNGKSIDINRFRSKDSKKKQTTGIQNTGNTVAKNVTEENSKAIRGNLENNKSKTGVSKVSDLNVGNKRKERVINKVHPQMPQMNQNSKTPQTAKNEPIKEENGVFPATLGVFEPLNPKYFYSRHYYLFRYILWPTLYSTTSCVFYGAPWLTFVLLVIGLAFDTTLAVKRLIFKTVLDNNAVIFENIVMFFVSLCFAIFLGQKAPVSENHGIGWAVIMLIAIAFVVILVFKVKGKKAL